MKNIQKEIDDFVHRFKEELVDPEVDALMSQYFSHPPENQLVPHEAWLKGKRKELQNLISGSDIRRKVKHGIDICIKDLKSHLPPVAFEKFEKEWELASEKFVAILHGEYQWEGDESGTTFEKILGLSQETIEGIYSSGKRFFEHHHYRESACIFLLLTLLNPYRYNVWLSLGLAEQHHYDYDRALKAYSMATTMKSESPMPHVYMAECYCSQGHYDEAKVQLKSSKEKLEQIGPGKEKIYEYIQKIEKENNLIKYQ